LLTEPLLVAIGLALAFASCALTFGLNGKKNIIGRTPIASFW